MNVQQHARIARIKQFSRYLYVCLTWIRYFLWVMWPLTAVFFLFGHKATLNIGLIQIEDVELSIVQRVLLVAVVSAFMFLALKLVYHFRELIQHFSAGDIFNKKAIDHARKALLNGLVIYAVYLSTLLASWIYIATQSAQTTVYMNANFILVFMFFGLMYILLWALEIGCDLNEESELTI
jgi:hypothetical protein